MKWNPEKQCVTKDDGSLLDHDKDFASVGSWTNIKYIRWLQDAVAATGKQTKDNTWLWKNGVKFTTTCHK